MANLKNGTRINGNIVWHSGNDGDGSGLNADFLNGNHSTTFSKTTHLHDLRYPQVFVGNLGNNSDISTRIANGGTSQEVIFDNWGRFSNNNSGNFPAKSDELSAWTYDSSANLVKCTLNSTTYIGFYSNDKYTDYTINAKLTSTATDNDRMGIVIAFYKDPADGKEYTLSALRNNDNDTFTWKVIYNYTQGSGNGEKVIGDKTSEIPRGGNWSSYPNGTMVQVIRQGNNIKCTTSENDATTLKPSSLIDFNLTDFPELSKFIEPSSYGFGCLSQDDSTFDFSFIPQGNKVLDQYLFNLDTNEVYKLDANGDYQLQTDTLTDVIPKNSILVDKLSHTQHYIDNTGILKTMGATGDANNLDGHNSADFMPVKNIITNSNNTDNLYYKLAHFSGNQNDQATIQLIGGKEGYSSGSNAVSGGVMYLQIENITDSDNNLGIKTYMFEDSLSDIGIVKTDTDGYAWDIYVKVHTFVGLKAYASQGVTLYTDTYVSTTAPTGYASKPALKILNSTDPAGSGSDASTLNSHTYQQLLGSPLKLNYRNPLSKINGWELSNPASNSIEIHHNSNNVTVSTPDSSSWAYGELDGYIFRVKGSVDNNVFGEIFAPNVSRTFNINSTNGYKIMEDGIIIQFGSSVLTSSTADINMPLTFPNAIISKTFSIGDDNRSEFTYIQGTGDGTLSKINIKTNATDGSSYRVNWIVIGY